MRKEACHLCPKCGASSLVADTRKRDSYIIRRRWCLKERKKHRWTTVELFAFKVRGSGKPSYERVTDKLKRVALLELAANLQQQAEDLRP